MDEFGRDIPRGRSRSRSRSRSRERRSRSRSRSRSPSRERHFAPKRTVVHRERDSIHNKDFETTNTKRDAANPWQVADPKGPHFRSRQSLWFAGKGDLDPRELYSANSLDTISEATRQIARARKPADLSEATEAFPIFASRSISELARTVVTTTHSTNSTPFLVPERMLSGVYTAREDVDELWQQKFRLDKVFDSGNARSYYAARNAIFPQDVSGTVSSSSSNAFSAASGSTRNTSRSCDKLLEIDQAVGVLAKAIPGAFIELSGGPGPFADLMLSSQRTGFGFAVLAPYQQDKLRERMAAAEVQQGPLPSTADMWYRSLQEHVGFDTIGGVDGCGNVFAPENARYVAEQVALGGQPLAIAIADAGWGIPPAKDGSHQEHLQELFCARMILGEIAIGVAALSPGGNFAVKIFDTFSNYTASLVYIFAVLFEQTYIVKPHRSRIVSAERYLVGLRLKGGPASQEDPGVETDDQSGAAALEVVRDALINAVATWDDESVPESLLPLSVLQEDKSFQDSFSKMSQTLTTNTTAALKAVMDEVDTRLRRQRTFAAPP